MCGENLTRYLVTGTKVHAPLVPLSMDLGQDLLEESANVAAEKLSKTKW
jgi:hypothetical protein